MKFCLSVLTFLAVTTLFGQDLTGRWVNSSFSGEENLAYVFSEEGTMTMFYAGNKIETKAPIKYTLKPMGELYHLSFSYEQKLNSFNASVLGLIKFSGKDAMEFETFDKKNLPEKLEFTEESLMFSRQ